MARSSRFDGFSLWRAEVEEEHMSEPKTLAQNIEEVTPGVWRWFVHDDRIDSESDAHAVVEKGRVVLIDPLPIDEAELSRLGTVDAICLTAKCHQRSAWRYRKHFGVRVIVKFWRHKIQFPFSMH